MSGQFFVVKSFKQPLAEAYQRLLEQGKAPCSVSTMHRILRQEGENGERRNQRTAQHHAIPRLKATAPTRFGVGILLNFLWLLRGLSIAVCGH